MKDTSLNEKELLSEVAALQARIVELENQLSAARDETAWLESAIKKRTVALNERSKELDCLYRMTSLLADTSRTPTNILEEFVGILPEALQFSAFGVARIVAGPLEFKSAEFEQARWRHSCDIVFGGRLIGSVEIGYLRLPKNSEPIPFLPEEGKLLHAVAFRLGEFIHHHFSQKHFR